MDETDRARAEAVTSHPATIGGRVAGVHPSIKSGYGAQAMETANGRVLGDATRMTALKCQCLLLARIAFGVNYPKANLEYERLAKDVLFWVMRHGFNSEDPKGVFCCPACTLSLLPLYATSCFRWVDCEELTSNVLTALKEGTSVFARTHPKAYAQWTLSLSSRTRHSTHDKRRIVTNRNSMDE